MTSITSQAFATIVKKQQISKSKSTSHLPDTTQMPQQIGENFLKIPGQQGSLMNSTSPTSSPILPRAFLNLPTIQTTSVSNPNSPVSSPVSSPVPQRSSKILCVQNTLQSSQSNCLQRKRSLSFSDFSNFYE